MIKQNHLKYLFTLGRPVSPLYGLAMKLRENFYLKGLFRQNILPVPVISIGNLVLGGTGKTPTTIYIAKLLRAAGYRPAVVSRGYGGRMKNRVNVVSNGDRALLSAEDGGDEPVQIARNLSGVPVLTGGKRIYPCWYAIREFGVNCILLDDGFQHMAVARDLDIVLFDCTSLAGNSRIFPGGPLREPVAALQRCDAFLLTGENEGNRVGANHFKALLLDKFPDKKQYISVSNLSFIDNERGDVVYPSGQGFAFCGIANPERFHTGLKDAGVGLVDFLSLDDHVYYDQSLIDSVVKKAKVAGADFLITTEKDWVKVQPFSVRLPLIITKLEQSVAPEFGSFILSKLKQVEQIKLMSAL